MRPNVISHPQGPQDRYTRWVKAVNPSVVLKHKQYRFIKTSEPRTLNLKPLSLGICCKKGHRRSILFLGLRPDLSGITSRSFRITPGKSDENVIGS